LKENTFEQKILTHKWNRARNGRNFNGPNGVNNMPTGSTSQRINGFNIILSQSIKQRFTSPDSNEDIQVDD